MRIKIRTNIIEIWLIGTFLLATNFLHFIDVSLLLSIKSDDLIIVWSVLLLGLYHVSSPAIPKRYYKSKWLFIFPLILCLIAAFVSNDRFGQNILRGFLAQRIIFVAFILYYPIKKAIYNKEFLSDRILKVIADFAWIEIVIVFVQCILYNYVRFTDIQFVYQWKNGQGMERLYFNAPIVTVAMFIWINNIFKKKRIIYSLIGILCSIIVIFIFGRTRMQIAGFLLTFFFAITQWKLKKREKVIIILFLFLACLMMTRTSLFEFILTAVNQSINSFNNTGLTRQIGRRLYFEALAKSPLFGNGYPHESCDAAIIAAGMDRGIYLNDNGIFGFAYVYGLIGVVWWIALFLGKFILSYKYFKENNNVCFMLFFLYNITILISLVFFTQNIIFGIIIVLVVAVLESKVYGCRKGNE